MWSDRYYYLKIYKDESLKSYCDTKKLIEFLKSIPELEQKSKYGFGNSNLFPFTALLLLLNAYSVDNWNQNDTSTKRTNLITIVCAKGKDVNFEELKRVFEQISSFLKWSLKTDNKEEFTEFE